ncbi:MAG TPA: hypothetical protein VMU61_16400 [Candidatus Aquilonibacter sp.]|nr:hypothetical protein [Candidatus Aquilonibacter sp.]
MDDRKMSQGRQNSGFGKLDRMLDVALAQYGSVEPRYGLEERVLANLRARQQERDFRSWLIWPAVAAAAALVLIAVTVVLMSGSGLVVRQVAHRNISPAQPNASAKVAGKVSHLVRPAVTASSPARRSATAVRTKVATLPKLDQFPSWQPPTEQEQILAMYVSRFHNQAVLLAELRAAEIRNEQMEDARKWRATADGDSEQLNQQTTDQ